MPPKLELEGLKDIVAVVRFHGRAHEEYAHCIVTFDRAFDEKGLSRHHPYAGLRLSCQLDMRMREEGRSTTSYAWRFQYDSVDVDEHNVTAMYQVLTRVQAKWEKMLRTHGSCKTFGEFVIRHLHALGIENAKYFNYMGGSASCIDGEFGPVKEIIDERLEKKASEWNCTEGWQV